MKAGIAIDSWKFPIFERHLKHAGYTFEEAGSITTDTRLLRVTTDNMEALYEVVKAANTEAALTGAPQ